LNRRNRRDALITAGTATATASGVWVNRTGGLDLTASGPGAAGVKDRCWGGYTVLI